MKLKRKISIMTLTIIVFIISLFSTFALKKITCEIRKLIELDLIKIALTLSSNPIIYENIGKEEGFEIINSYANDIRVKADVDFIVVTDMKAIRYSHTNKEMLGKPFSNVGITKVIRDGETYIEEGEGLKGVTVKAFTPVFNEGVQVGAICVGVRKLYISKANKNFITQLVPIIVIVIIIGYIVSKALAKNIKKQIYGLEPDEIALLLKEREVILDGISDGLIAINKEGKIKLVNDRAKEILKINDSCINKDINVLHHKISNKLKELLDNKISIINLEQKLNSNITIVSNYSLLENNGLTLGAIITFKSMADVSTLIEMLAGVEKLNWDLRAQNHEFMNKLQTISGLIQLERYEQALEYIHITTMKRNEVLKTLDNIKVVSIAALLLAKLDKAEEAKITMKINPKSNLRLLPNGINEIELGCIVGNLIENSIEVLKGKKDGEIEVSISQEDNVKIVVINNGEEINEEERKKIFKRGYSTKGKERGLGLSNINEIIQGVNGKIELESNVTKTTWSVEV